MMSVPGHLNKLRRRPRGEKDVPFRFVASRLIKGLDESNREAYDLLIR